MQLAIEQNLRARSRPLGDRAKPTRTQLAKALRMERGGFRMLEMMRAMLAASITT
jgi:hypothetical protein